MDGKLMPLLSREQIKFKVGKINFDRGKEYYETGAVSGLSHQGHTVRAKCQGSQADKYDVWVLVEPRVADVHIRDAYCSCPVGDGGRCKHVAAVLLTWADSATQGPVGGGPRKSPSSVSPPPVPFAKHHTVGTATPYRPRVTAIVGGDASIPGDNENASLADRSEQQQRPTKRLRIVPPSTTTGGGSTASGPAGIDEEVLGTMGIRRWNRRDPALRRRSTEEYTRSSSSLAAREDQQRVHLEMATDGNESLLDHLQQEVAELRNLLERKEREVEQERKERRDLRKVVRLQRETIAALRLRLESAGLLDETADEDRSHPKVDAGGPDREDDQEEEKEVDVDKILNEERDDGKEAQMEDEQGKAEKSAGRKETEEETMTLLLDAMEQETTLPGSYARADDDHHHDNGGGGGGGGGGGDKTTWPEREKEQKGDDKRDEEGEEEDAEALLRETSLTLRFDSDYEDYPVGNEERPSEKVQEEERAEPSDHDLREEKVSPERQGQGKRKRDEVEVHVSAIFSAPPGTPPSNDSVTPPEKVSLSALLRKHLSPLRPSSRLHTATDRRREDEHEDENKNKNEDEQTKACRQQASSSSASSTTTPARRSLMEMLTATPPTLTKGVKEAAASEGGEERQKTGGLNRDERRTKEAVSPMFKALFLSHPKKII